MNYKILAEVKGNKVSTSIVNCKIFFACKVLSASKIILRCKIHSSMTVTYPYQHVLRLNVILLGGKTSFPVGSAPLKHTGHPVWRCNNYWHFRFKWMECLLESLLAAVQMSLTAIQNVGRNSVPQFVLSIYLRIFALLPNSAPPH